MTTSCAVDIWEQYKTDNDPALRQQLILQYAPLVKYVVGRMAISLPGILDSEDIISHATIGLIDAIERFDHRRGLKFETYAILRIRGSVIDTVRRLGGIPRGAHRKLREIEAAVTVLEEQLGRTPIDDEVAKYLGISLETYNKELLDVSITVVPLEKTLRESGDDESLSLAEVIADATSPCPAKEAERGELKEKLRQAIGELVDRDRLLLALYYQEELTLKEISQVLEVSESRVCQLHAKVILKLRKSLATAGMLVAV